MRLIDADELREEVYSWGMNDYEPSDFTDAIDDAPTVEAIPKDNVYKAIQEMMKYEHEGFINISLARLEEILKKCGVSEDGTNEKTSD
jgi:hypothetical protein